MSKVVYKSRFSPTHGAFSTKTIERVADQLIDWVYSNDRNYAISKFALEAGIHRQRFPEWAAKNEKFRHAYQMAKQKQEWYIFDGALHNRLSPNVAKFALINEHGWVDRTETTVKQEPVFAQINESTQKKLEQRLNGIENQVEEPEIVTEEQNL